MNRTPANAMSVPYTKNGMNTQYFVYALEVEKTASITQAAEKLFMTQPTLSKAIKELERNVGFAVFQRTSKGVVPTQKGRVFLEHARKIVAQIDKMEQDFQQKDPVKQMFSLAIPRAGDISIAAAKFLRSFEDTPEMELNVRETCTANVIAAVAEESAVLGIVRCRASEEPSLCGSLTEKGLQYEIIHRASYVALLPEEHPLAKAAQLQLADFEPYIQIAFGDEPDACAANRRILIYDRAMQFDLLRANPMTYLWCSPLPQELLTHTGCIQRTCINSCAFADVLISKAGYHYSDLDCAFLNELTRTQENAACEQPQ